MMPSEVGGVMRSLLVTLFTVFLALAPLATAQGLRGAAPGMGSSARPGAQTGTITSQTRQGGASTTTITTTTAPGGALAPNGQFRSTPIVTPQLFVPPVFHGG